MIARLLTMVVAVSVVLGAVAGPGYAQPEKIAAGLWTATAGGQPASFLVILAQQADLDAADAVADPADRRQWVYDTLRQTALRSQRSLRAALDRQGIPYTTHYLVNMLAVEGDRALLLALARRSDVARLEPNPSVAGVPPLSELDLRRSPASPAGVEWGVSFVRAPQVWATYGARGQGVVVGVQDTGVAWDHPALQPSYRGWDGSTVDHATNWHSAVGSTPACPDPATPCDPYGHGTHVVGTISGDDGAGNQIGVAPGAAWIGCRNMDDAGRGTPSSYTECFEFFLAPWPPGGDPQARRRPQRWPPTSSTTRGTARRARAAATSHCSRWWRPCARPASWWWRRPATTAGPAAACSTPSRPTTPATAWLRSMPTASSLPTAAAAP